MTPQISQLATSLVTLVGLIVLVALGKTTADVAIPLIVAITGVHVGAGINANTAAAVIQNGVHVGATEHPVAVVPVSPTEVTK